VENEIDWDFVKGHYRVRVSNHARGNDQVNFGPAAGENWETQTDEHVVEHGGCNIPQIHDNTFDDSTRKVYAAGSELARELKISFADPDYDPGDSEPLYVARNQSFRDKIGPGILFEGMGFLFMELGKINELNQFVLPDGEVPITTRHKDLPNCPLRKEFLNVSRIFIIDRRVVHVKVAWYNRKSALDTTLRRHACLETGRLIHDWLDTHPSYLHPGSEAADYYKNCGSRGVQTCVDAATGRLLMCALITPVHASKVRHHLANYVDSCRYFFDKQSQLCNFYNAVGTCLYAGFCNNILAASVAIRDLADTPQKDLGFDPSEGMVGLFVRHHTKLFGTTSTCEHPRCAPWAGKEPLAPADLREFGLELVDIIELCQKAESDGSNSKGPQLIIEKMYAFIRRLDGKSKGAGPFSLNNVIHATVGLGLNKFVALARVAVPSLTTSNRKKQQDGTKEPVGTTKPKANVEPKGKELHQNTSWHRFVHRPTGVKPQTRRKAKAPRTELKKEDAEEKIFFVRAVTIMRSVALYVTKHPEMPVKEVQWEELENIDCESTRETEKVECRLPFDTMFAHYTDHDGVYSLKREIPVVSREGGKERVVIHTMENPPLIEPANFYPHTESPLWKKHLSPLEMEELKNRAPIPIQREIDYQPVAMFGDVIHQDELTPDQWNRLKILFAHDPQHPRTYREQLDQIMLIPGFEKKVHVAVARYAVDIAKHNPSSRQKAVGIPAGQVRDVHQERLKAAHWFPSDLLEWATTNRASWIQQTKLRRQHEIDERNRRAKARRDHFKPVPVFETTRGVRVSRPNPARRVSWAPTTHADAGVSRRNAFATVAVPLTSSTVAASPPSTPSAGPRVAWASSIEIIQPADTEIMQPAVMSSTVVTPPRKKKTRGKRGGKKHKAKKPQVVIDTTDVNILATPQEVMASMSKRWKNVIDTTNIKSAASPEEVNAMMTNNGQQNSGEVTTSPDVSGAALGLCDLMTPTHAGIPCWDATNAFERGQSFHYPCNDDMSYWGPVGSIHEDLSNEPFNLFGEEIHNTDDRKPPAMKNGGLLTMVLGAAKPEPRTYDERALRTVGLERGSKPVDSNQLLTKLGLEKRLGKIPNVTGAPYDRGILDVATNALNAALPSGHPQVRTLAWNEIDFVQLRVETTQKSWTVLDCRVIRGVDQVKNSMRWLEEEGGGDQILYQAQVSDQGGCLFPFNNLDRCKLCEKIGLQMGFAPLLEFNGVGAPNMMAFFTPQQAAVHYLLCLILTVPPRPFYLSERKKCTKALNKMATKGRKGSTSNDMGSARDSPDAWRVGGLMSSGYTGEDAIPYMYLFTRTREWEQGNSVLFAIPHWECARAWTKKGRSPKTKGGPSGANGSVLVDEMVTYVVSEML